MPKGWVQGWTRGLAAVLVLVGLLLAGWPTPAPAHPTAPDVAVAVAAAQTGSAQPPCDPGEPHGMPCCQESACTAHAVPGLAMQVLAHSAARHIIVFVSLQPHRLAGTVPDPGMRPPRTVV